MSMRVIRGILIVILAVFAGGTWLSCGGGMTTCEFCGESFPVSNTGFHKRKCKKNPTDQRIGPASGKTVKPPS